MSRFEAHTDFRGPFAGAKLLLFIGGRLVVLLRDDKPGIPFPGYWDLPGGGRDGTESPAACVLRETREETALSLRETDLIWARKYAEETRVTWCFAAHLPEVRAADMRLGSEGQRLSRMSPKAYAAHPRAIPHFVTRLSDYLAETP